MRPSLRCFLLASDGTAFGGAERYTLDLTRAARRHELEAHIWHFARSADHAAAFPATVCGDIPVHRATATSRWPALAMLRSFQAVLHRVRPDAVLINASSRPGFWLTAWLARRSGIPVVWIHHMVESAPAPGARRRRFGRMEGPQFWRIRPTVRHQLASLAARWVIASNPSDAAAVARRHAINPGKIRIIPPGIDLASFAAPGPEPVSSPPAADFQPPVIGAAARLVPGKGMDHLLDALALLSARRLPFTALIAGDGPERARLERRSAELQIDARVCFLGALTDMPAFYRSLDLFVSPSHSESFGLTLAEAMASRCAVIATPTAGARQQIQHLHNGWLLDGFASAELAQALAVLSSDPELRQRLAVQARADVAARASIDATLKRFLRLFERPAASAALPVPPGTASAPVPVVDFRHLSC